MLPLLKNALYQKDFSTKKCVGIYVDVDGDDVSFHCVSRGQSAAHDPIFFEHMFNEGRVEVLDSDDELDRALLFVSFSALEFKYVNILFDSFPKKPKDQKKFLYWRLAKDWGISEEDYSIRYVVFPQGSGYQVEIYACDNRVFSLTNLIAQHNNSLIVQSRPQVIRLLGDLFSDDNISVERGTLFYLQANCWSIANWTGDNGLKFLRSQTITHGFGVEQAFRDLESLHENQFDPQNAKPQIYIAYDPDCSTEIREQTRSLLAESTLSADELLQKDGIDYPSWQMRYADYAIPL